MFLVYILYDLWETFGNEFSIIAFDLATKPELSTYSYACALLV
jgi:hypothetical protein